MAVSGPSERLRQGKALEPGEMTVFMNRLMDGEAAEDEIRDFLTALRSKGETVPDIIEAARVMRERSLKVPIDGAGLLDTCGTGGDGLRTVNVSTLAALAAAAAGARVAKHGNRSVSGLFGSADLLEALNIRIDLKPEQVARSIEATGFGFIFAPAFHPAMKYAAAARKKIEGRTLFNCLGPLTNPAGAERQLIGVYDAKLVVPLCEALGRLGAKKVIVVCGENGLDEVSLSGPTRCAEWRDGRAVEFSCRPEDYGFKTAPVADLQCGSGEESVRAARAVIAGQRGPALDFVSLNAAFALRAAGIVEDIGSGARFVHSLFVEGLVSKKIDRICEFGKTL